MDFSNLDAQRRLQALTAVLAQGVIRIHERKLSEIQRNSLDIALEHPADTALSVYKLVDSQPGSYAKRSRL